MNYQSARALELLRLGTQNPAATFRDDQEDAIRHVVEGRGRLLVVQKTGWGKRAVYFIAPKLLREQGAGPAILISHLLSLMRNQIAAAERMGVRAATIHSDNRDEWENVEAALQRDEVDILLISPERLTNDHFRDEVLRPAAGRISLLVVDEAHCISDWGHDFRPHYRFIERMVRQLPGNLRLLATTATANQRVMDDLESILGPGLEVSRGGWRRRWDCHFTRRCERRTGGRNRRRWPTATSRPGTSMVRWRQWRMPSTMVLFCWWTIW
ncbi:MAG: DEAD/DEAH box helicase [Akkermansiaceae bacterium]|nr:DEAD/DEAH box helicase [Akkermansiaceae bacterium]